MLRAFQASREGRSWSHGQCQANPSHVQPHLWPPRPVFLCERSWKTWETHEKKWKKHEKSNKINKSTIEHGCQCPKSCRNVLKCVEMCVQMSVQLMLQQGIQRTSPVFRHSTLYALRFYTPTVRCHGKGQKQTWSLISGTVRPLPILFSLQLWGSSTVHSKFEIFQWCSIDAQLDSIWCFLGGTGWYWVSAHEHGQSSDRAGHNLAGSGSRLTTHT